MEPRVCRLRRHAERVTNLRPADPIQVPRPLHVLRRDQFQCLRRLDREDRQIQRRWLQHELLRPFRGGVAAARELELPRDIEQRSTDGSHGGAVDHGRVGRTPCSTNHGGNDTAVVRFNLKPLAVSTNLCVVAARRPAFLNQAVRGCSLSHSGLLPSRSQYLRVSTTGSRPSPGAPGSALKVVSRSQGSTPEASLASAYPRPLATGVADLRARVLRAVFRKAGGLVAAVAGKVVRCPAVSYQVRSLVFRRYT